MNLDQVRLVGLGWMPFEKKMKSKSGPKYVKRLKNCSNTSIYFLFIYVKLFSTCVARLKSDYLHADHHDFEALDFAGILTW